MRIWRIVTRFGAGVLPAAADCGAGTQSYLIATPKYKGGIAPSCAGARR